MGWMLKNTVKGMLHKQYNAIHQNTQIRIITPKDSKVLSKSSLSFKVGALNLGKRKLDFFHKLIDVKHTAGHKKQIKMKLNRIKKLFECTVPDVSVASSISRG